MVNNTNNTERKMAKAYKVSRTTGGDYFIMERATYKLLGFLCRNSSTSWSAEPEGSPELDKEFPTRTAAAEYVYAAATKA